LNTIEIIGQEQSINLIFSRQSQLLDIFFEHAFSCSMLPMTNSQYINIYIRPGCSPICGTISLPSDANDSLWL